MNHMFSYSGNREWRKNNNMSFIDIIALTRITYLGKILTKEMKELSAENYKK